MEDSQRPHDPVNVFNADVELRGTAWCVVSLIDGQRKVVSRHPSAEAARSALASLNESGERGRTTTDPA